MVNVNVRPYGQKIATFSCKFPSQRTENSIYMILHLTFYYLLVNI